MKLKSWVVWLLVAVFLASEIFLFSANRQKGAALVSLREARQQAEDLQAQLDQIKSSNADSQSAELARLRAENQELPRLRNQVTQLTTANQKLAQQLSSTHAFAQQQQEQLQQADAEKQQARAAAQAEDERDICLNILRQIYYAKQQWALEYNKTADAIPTAQDIASYIKPDANGNIHECPSGGTYTIGAVGEPPSCSIHGAFVP